MAGRVRRASRGPIVMSTTGPVFDYQSPQCLLLSAESFYDCARLLQAASEDRLDLSKLIPGHKNFQRPALYANACRAIELAFKAYLRAAGDDLSQLRKKGGANGHDLELLLVAATKAGMNVLSLTPEEIEQFTELSERYRSKDFDYPDLTNNRGSPSVAFAITIAQRAIELVTPFCRANTDRHLNQPSAAKSFEAKRNYKAATANAKLLGSN